MFTTVPVDKEHKGCVTGLHEEIQTTEPEQSSISRNYQKSFEQGAFVRVNDQWMSMTVCPLCPKSLSAQFCRAVGDEKVCLNIVKNSNSRKSETSYRRTVYRRIRHKSSAEVRFVCRQAQTT